MRTFLLLGFASLGLLSLGTSALAAVSGQPPANIAPAIPITTGPPNIQFQSAQVVLAPQCTAGKPILIVTATVANTGGDLAAKTATIAAVDSVNQSWGRIDFLPALRAGQSATVTVNVDYLQSNPAGMVGQHTIGVGPYNKPPVLNIKVTVPAAFCGFNPGVALARTSGGPVSTAVSNAALHPLVLGTPTGLRYATDLTTCSSQVDQYQCEGDIDKKDAFLLWSPGVCTDPKCAPHITGFRVYEVPHGWQPPILGPVAPFPSALQPPGPASSTSISAGAGTNSSTSSSASTTASSSRTSAVQMNSAPPSMALNNFVPILVLTQTAPHNSGILSFAEMAPPETVNRCFTVTAYYQDAESAFSNPVCIAYNAAVGPIHVTLDPNSVATAYGGIRCPGTPPFSHPGGSIINGDYANDKGYCPYYQGLLTFDVSHIDPARVKSASLTYDFLGYFNPDGSVDGAQFTGWNCRQIYTTIIGLEKLPDPNNGLVMTDNHIDQVSDASHSIGLTSLVNDTLSRHGLVRIVFGTYGGMSVIGHHCYAEFGNFHLVLDAYGTK